MKRRIIYGLLLVLTFILFYSLLSEDILMSASGFMAFLGGVLCAVFLIQFVADYRDFDEVKELQTLQHKLGLVCIPSVIVFIIVLNVHYSGLEDKIILKYGKRVEGIIKNGRSTSGGTESNSYITVAYTTPKGNDVEKKFRITSEQFDAAKKDMPVEVLHCTKYPSATQILIGDDVIERFTGMKNRVLSLSDLTAMLDMKADSLQRYANTVSYRWIRIDNYPYFLVNGSEDLTLEFAPGETIIYTMRNSKYYEPLLEEMKKEGFKPVGDKKEGVYSKGNIGVKISYGSYDIKSNGTYNVGDASIKMPAFQGVSQIMTFYKL
ncbi:hypothetical protein [Chitinophaga tropicalis]|uniref:DUF3592 domain-containing protein n=1 Tax=Chitinophaga tropicalis TaxID=2683588 RepID=A0A7K1U240_9BACT|nr:hypothetical protein [Chitinophaga tropicalis]MVT08442.1 hypothetical protein [Chitinophaga tropicalis]